MNKAKVAIIGLGTVGKRIADAVAAQNDMKVIGVVKRHPTPEAQIAVHKGYTIYVPDSKSREEFRKANIPVAESPIHTLFDEADVLVIATPDGTAQEYIELRDNYKFGLPAIVQGGERHDLVGLSFNAMANYEKAIGRNSVRVVSCNTTALVRILWSLDAAYGIENVNATIIRRAADPNDNKTGPINAIIPEPEISSHHGSDVQTILPDIKITTMAVKVPTTHMHVHALHIRLVTHNVNRDNIIDLFKGLPRIRLVGGNLKIKSTADIIELARDMGRPRNDMWENVVWENSIVIKGQDLYLFEAVHQESIVVPENIDAIRAMLKLETSGETSIIKTNNAIKITG